MTIFQVNQVKLVAPLDFHSPVIFTSVGLSFFGHLARTAPREDHHRVIAATLRPPADWRRPVGRPRTTWLRTINDNLQPVNFKSTRLGARQHIGTFSIKSSVLQHFTEEFIGKEEGQTLVIAPICRQALPQRCSGTWRTPSSVAHTCLIPSQP